MRISSVRDLTLSAMLAAIYAVLTIALPIQQYGGIQVRIAEALVILPFLFPQTTLGLTVGCFLANLFSPMPLDMIFGTAATLLACLWTQRMPNRWLAPLPPVICNGVIVGAELAYTTVGFSPAFWPTYGFFGVTVALGEVAACYVLGLLLLSVLPRVPVLRHYIPQSQRVKLGVQG